MSSFTPVKQFQSTITGNTTASAAQSLETDRLPSATNLHNRQVRVFAKSADVVLKFGGASVAASATITSGAMADDNFVQAAGTTEVYDLRSDQTYYSGVSLDGLTAGNIYVTLGYAENRQQK